MDVGMMRLFAGYGWDHIRDDAVWAEELQLARLAAHAGFDVLWSAEHHFGPGRWGCLRLKRTASCFNVCIASRRPHS